MLNQISTGARTATETTAQGMLLSCHKRIRHYSEMACRLAHAHSAPADEIVRAAVDIHRYFTIALPLHEADENRSLHPRLITALTSDGSASSTNESAENAVLRRLAGPAANAMVEQHESIDQLVERLVPLCTILMNKPEELDEVSAELHQISAALREIFDVHLKLEEETVIPAMEQFLTKEELAQILNEMKARRS